MGAAQQQQQQQQLQLPQQQQNGRGRNVVSHDDEPAFFELYNYSPILAVRLGNHGDVVTSATPQQLVQWIHELQPVIDTVVKKNQVFKVHPQVSSTAPGSALCLSRPRMLAAAARAIRPPALLRMPRKLCSQQLPGRTRLQDDGTRYLFCVNPELPPREAAKTVLALVVDLRSALGSVRQPRCSAPHAPGAGWGLGLVPCPTAVLPS